MRRRQTSRSSWRSRGGEFSAEGEDRVRVADIVRTRNQRGLRGSTTDQQRVAPRNPRPRAKAEAAGAEDAGADGDGDRGGGRRRGRQGREEPERRRRDRAHSPRARRPRRSSRPRSRTPPDNCTDEPVNAMVADVAGSVMRARTNVALAPASPSRATSVADYGTDEEPTPKAQRLTEQAVRAHTEHFE